MTIGIVIEETMTGWLKLDGEKDRQFFEFSIRAYTKKFFRLDAPREFRGMVRLGTLELPTNGVLTIRPTGPKYEMDLLHPAHGKLHVEGHKTYSLHPAKFSASLVTCPLIVMKNGKQIGMAEAVYQHSMLHFFRTAVHLVREKDAFGDYKGLEGSLPNR